MSNLDLFHFFYQDNGAPNTLFLLHGTGGDERDLLPLADSYADYFNFVGIRGNVSEHGMPRFFRRFELGRFDLENIKEETEKLSRFLTDWYTQHTISANQSVFLGYSNGANMILAMVFLYPVLIKQAILLHPMLPIEPSDVTLGDKRFLVTYGENDQMIPASEGKKVLQTLTDQGAEITAISHQGGHEIRNVELEAIHAFLGRDRAEFMTNG